MPAPRWTQRAVRSGAGASRCRKASAPRFSYSWPLAVTTTMSCRVRVFAIQGRRAIQRAIPGPRSPAQVNQPDLGVDRTTVRPAPRSIRPMRLKAGRWPAAPSITSRAVCPSRAAARTGPASFGARIRVGTPKGGAPAGAFRAMASPVGPWVTRMRPAAPEARTSSARVRSSGWRTLDQRREGSSATTRAPTAGTTGRPSVRGPETPSGPVTLAGPWANPFTDPSPNVRATVRRSLNGASKACFRVR